MREPSVLAAALLAALLAAPLHAQDDAAREARILATEGKFREVDALIEHAGPEVQNDTALHLVVADFALKVAKSKTGEDARDPTFSARQHFAKVVELKPADPTAAAGLLQTAQTLAQLDVAARKPDDAKAQAKFALELAEKSVAAGVATKDFKLQLARMYALRASFVKTMKDVEQLVSDSTKAGALLSEVAGMDTENAGKLLSEASAIRLSTANLIHEGIPVATEARDDDALAEAIDYATRACGQSGAVESDFATHLSALRLAHSWGMKLAQKPFMTPLGPPIQGLKLETPRSGGWERSKAPADWDLLLERNLHDPKNDGTVQIMLKAWPITETSLGKTWDKLDEIAPRRFDKYKEDQGELGSVVPPVMLGGGGKNSLDLWHYEVGGKLKTGRDQRIGEWIWFGDRKKEFVWQLKVIDWRRVADIEDPDIVAFVTSAIGEGLWPAGAAPAKGKDEPKPKDPKKPPPKKGK